MSAWHIFNTRGGKCSEDMDTRAGDWDLDQAMEDDRCVCGSCIDKKDTQGDEYIQPEPLTQHKVGKRWKAKR